MPAQAQAYQVDFSLTAMQGSRLYTTRIEGEKAFLLRGIAAGYASTGRYKFNVKSESRSEQLCPKEVRDDLWVGSGKNLFFLHTYFLFYPGDILQCVVSDLSNDVNTGNITLCGSEFLASKKTGLPLDKNDKTLIFDRAIQHVTYTTDDLDLTANTMTEGAIEVRSNRNFICRSLTIRPTDAASLTVNLYSTLRKEKIWRADLYFGAINGTANFPYPLLPGYFFPAGDTILVDVTDKSGGAQSNVAVALHGEEKIVPVGIPEELIAQGLLK